MPDNIRLNQPEDYVPECIQNASQSIAGLLNIDEIKKSFSTFKTDQERFEFLWTNPITHDVVVLEPEYDAKNDETAAAERTKGNEYFKKKSYLSATQSYTKAVIYASDRKELGLAYANRSAALFHFGKYDLSIRDIELALQCDYPAENVFKLYERRALCWKELKNKPLAEEAMADTRKHLELSGLKENLMQQCKERHDQLAKDISNLKETHSRNYNTQSYIGRTGNFSKSQVNSDNDVPGVSGSRHKDNPTLIAALTIGENKDKGRHVVSKAELNPGDVLVREDPYAAILYRAYHASHCYHCMERTLAPIPCTQCVHVSYCSLQCRDDAWTRFHRHECRFYALFDKDWCGRIGHLAHRIVMETGADKIVQFINELESGVEKSLINPRFDEVWRLVTNTKDYPFEALYKYTIMANFIVILLYTCGYLSKTPDGALESLYMTDPDISRLGGAILRFIQAVQCNAKGVRELMQPTDFEDPKSTDIGTGLYLTCALFNHDCFPNATLVFYGDKVIVRSIRGIFTGEEVTLSYGPEFHTSGGLGRHRWLRQTYFFYCDCTACENNWPFFRDIEAEYPYFCCPKCHKYIDLGSKLNDGPVISCDTCGEQVDVEVAWGKLGVAHDAFAKSLEEAVCGQAEKALVGFIQYMKTMQYCIMMPWKEMLMCQAAIETTYKLRGNRKPYYT